MRGRLLAFVAIVAVTLTGVGLYVAVRLGSPTSDSAAAGSASRSAIPALPLAPVTTPPDVTVPPGEPPTRLLFRRTSRDAQAGMLALAPMTDPSAVAVFDALRCERVHMAGGRGVCLTADRGVFTTFTARVFDATFKPSASIPLAGAPSRVQVSPDGTHAGITVFVAGHSYADGGFSTRTSMMDLSTGAWMIEDFESLTVHDKGGVRRAADFNFWGVTFARDSRRFYATLGTAGQPLLVKGELGSGRVDVVATDVECPSLSPDNRRVAFKQRDGAGLDGIRWRLWVLDLASGERHALAETRNVDDQVQWLDDATIVYALPAEGRPAETDMWVVPGDGSGTPRLLIRQAYSASVIR